LIQFHFSGAGKQILSEWQVKSQVLLILLCEEHTQNGVIANIQAPDLVLSAGSEVQEFQTCNCTKVGFSKIHCTISSIVGMQITCLGL
jgi:hypothetical protein